MCLDLHSPLSTLHTQHIDPYEEDQEELNNGMCSMKNTYFSLMVSMCLDLHTPHSALHTQHIDAYGEYNKEHNNGMCSMKNTYRT
jgi:hypothetical protein